METFEDRGSDQSLGIGLKFMLAAAFSLFVMVFLIIFLKFCAKYLIVRSQHRRHHNDLQIHQINTQIAPIDVESPKSGLDPLVIASLPKLLYKQTDQFSQGEVIECSVCLGNIVEDATIRVLPNCKHIFHVACVDKWFSSNTTCPICRTEVEPKVQPGLGHWATWVQAQPTAPPTEGGDEPQGGN